MPILTIFSPLYLEFHPDITSTAHNVTTRVPPTMYQPQRNKGHEVHEDLCLKMDSQGFKALLCGLGALRAFVLNPGAKRGHPRWINHKGTKNTKFTKPLAKNGFTGF
jgi:hypothetical protein